MIGIQTWDGRARHAISGTPEERSMAEADLLQAARAGDPGAQERLLVPYERALYALCYGVLGHAEDAEDAVQDTFVRVLRALPGFRGDATFRTWLFRVAINVCLDRRRSRRPVDPLPDEGPPVGSPATSPEAIAIRDLRLREALAGLLPRHRAILLLKEREGWSVTEIGAATGWSRKRVENELFKARRALADWRRRDAAEGEER